MASDDYRIDGYILHRLDTGTNPRLYWLGAVKVIHDPADRLVERKRAQVALVRLDIDSASGVSSERIGDYSVAYGVNMRGPTYTEQRAAILEPLKPLMVA